MDQKQHDQATKGIGPLAHGKKSNPMLTPTNPPTQVVGISVPSSFPGEQHPQYNAPWPQEENLQEQLKNFWLKQCQEIKESTDFKTHSLPLAKIKKIMKANEDVGMISAESPVVFSKTCELFIMDLTKRAWAYAKENGRRILYKRDITYAISRTDVFDFLDDAVPRDDTTNELVSATVPGINIGPIENVSSPQTMVIGKACS